MRFLGVVFFLLLCTPAGAITFLLEAESLELFGGWEPYANLRSEVARGFLQAPPEAAKAPAVGAIDLPHEGQWRLWARSKDFPADRPGTRRYSVRIGEVRAGKMFGAHGQAELEGWAWEDGGTLELKSGANLVVIGEEVLSTARCDALVLTDNMSYRPEGVPWRLAKAPAVKAPLALDEAARPVLMAAPLASISEEIGATLEQGNLRLNFMRATTADGVKTIALRALVRKPGGAWEELPLDSSDEGYRLLVRPEASPPKIDSVKVYPTWDGAFGPIAEVSAGGASARTRLGTPTTPWTAGEGLALHPTNVRQGRGSVHLEFPDTPYGQLTASWSLGFSEGPIRAQRASLPMPAVIVHFTPRVPGYYSIGYHAPLAVTPAEADFLLLPFMLHGRRFPEHPAAMLNSSMPTPLALVTRAGFTCGVAADPRVISPEWPSFENAKYALGLRNAEGKAQPFAYSPVLGQPGSSSKGERISAIFHVLMDKSDWYTAYRHVADELFALRDYRSPTAASLSDSALNLLDFIRDEKSSGWNARAKGPWNIESRNTVSHSAPLTYLSLYLLTGDRDFYRRFARPALEFMLSRPSPHFAAEREIWENYYQHQPMRGVAPLYGARWFAAALAMTHGRSPGFGEFLLKPDGEPRVTSPHGHTHAFEDALALHQLTGEARWLEAARAGADKYIEANLTKLPERDLGHMPFVNVSFVPNWEGLLHLYEATGEKRYLEASNEAARWLLTTLWTQPVLFEEETTIHPGGVYDAQRHLWWWGDRLYRRGIIDIPATEEPPYPPAPALPERKVSSWTVSQIGLGLEQPSTFNRKGPRANIMMNNWAPNLLRLEKATGDRAFLTAARNAMIGRFGNYPGYYLDGFTDEYHRPDYPATGPDVTSFYVHHVPPFTASVLDYLFTDAEMRTKGAVAFPSVRQCGYVWFDNRLFGHAPGKFYGHTAWPWLHRTAAEVSNRRVDRVLAHGEGKFHVLLMNQTRFGTSVRVSFDPKALGREVEGAAVELRLDGGEPQRVTIANGGIDVQLQALGFAALTLDGVKIDVPTHRVAPPGHLPIPTPGALRRAPLPGTALEAVGTTLQVPPFEWRDLYVYLTAGLDDLRAARLRYRVGKAPEKIVEAASFPWEFSAEIPAGEDPVTWTVEAQLPGGAWVATK